MGSLSLREYRRFPRETLMIHEKDHLTRNDFENFSKKFFKEIFHIDIICPVYLVSYIQRAGSPKLLFLTLNSQLILISQGDSVLAFFIEGQPLGRAVP